MNFNDNNQEKIWCLGVLEISNPYSLADAIRIIVSLCGKNISKQMTVKDLTIFGSEIITRNLVEPGKYTPKNIGIAWRSALQYLGFLYPEVLPASGISQSQIGPVDMITPNGWRLNDAETVPAMQECFLRALAARYMPSVVGFNAAISVFWPLQHTLRVMLALEKQVGESRLDFVEMATVVQLCNEEKSLLEIVSELLELRKRRLLASDKNQFDNLEIDAFAFQHGYAASTVENYATTNFRYIRATRLIQKQGIGIVLFPEKHFFVEKMIQDVELPFSDKISCVVNLCRGATLPTDNMEFALVALNDLVQQLDQRENSFDKKIHATDISVINLQTNSILLQKKEEEYAAHQKFAWQEIVGFMDLIVNNKAIITLANGEEIQMPQSQAQSYLEWVVWRAFLAIGGMITKPDQARYFKIDQNFLPIDKAPDHKPDMVFEFADFVLVVEVTLTDNSRQEAAEGEPVRRHVADLVQHHAAQSGKQVYGLFIANHIDSNTAETFRIGCWYTRADDKMRLDITPLTIEQFKTYFAAMFGANRVQVSLIRELLDLCSHLRPAHEAPAWKAEISKIVAQRITHIQNQTK